MAGRKDMVAGPGAGIRSAIAQAEKVGGRKEHAILKEKLSMQENVLGDVYYELATMYARQKLYPEAIDAYEQTIRHTSEHPRAYYHLGLLYEYQEKNSRKALHYFKKCLLLDLGAEVRRNVQKLIKVVGEK